MSLNTWWLFVVAVFLLSGTPGPNMLHVMTSSLAHGARASVATMAGCLAAVVLALAASAAGVAALLEAVPGAFDLLRWVGAAYLVFLGIKAWRGGAAALDVGEGEVPATSRRSRFALFRGGFAIGISNPKLLLFAAAFLPQFVTDEAPRAPQFAVLVATFAVIESGWYLVYALGGRGLARVLRRPGLRRGFDRATGALFVVFGLALLGTRPVA